MGKTGKDEPNLWKEAYQALYEDSEEKEQMQKLQTKLRKRLDDPTLDLRSELSYKKMISFIKVASDKIAINKCPERFRKVCQHMLQIKDLVGTGVAVGGPYAAIPAAALFLVFSMEDVYSEEKDAMIELAENASDYWIYSAKSHDLIRYQSDDDKDMQRLRQKLRTIYVGLYKAIFFASAQLANFLCNDSALVVWLKNAIRMYNWKEQLDHLEKRYRACERCCDEMQRRIILGLAPKTDPKAAMGPGPRNALHWAVVDKLHARVDALVASKECPINALTRKSWTAAHLAAEHGNTKIMKTLRSAPGIDFNIKNDDGCTPLHVAALNNSVGAVEIILDYDRKLLHARDKKKWTAFLLAAMNGHVKVLEVLKNRGQDLNETTVKNGWSGLHIAAENGHVGVVKFLLANGANKNMRTTGGALKGSTAKHIAERKGKMQVVELL